MRKRLLPLFSTLIAFGTLGLLFILYAYSSSTDLRKHKISSSPVNNEFSKSSIAVLSLQRFETGHLSAPVYSRKVNNIFICHEIQEPQKMSHSKNVLVYSASTFLGFRTASHLHNHGLKVKPIEVLSNIPMDERAWFRWQKLSTLKMDPEFVESTSFEKIISSHNIDTILFVPSNVFDGQTVVDKDIKLQQGIQGLQNFVELLETVAAMKNRVNIRIVLLSSSKELSSIQKSWLVAYELTLSSYQSLYGLQTNLIRMKGVYGPWEGNSDSLAMEKRSANNSCVFVGEVESAVLKSLRQQDKCVDIDISNEGCPTNEKGMSETITWAKEHNHFLTNRKDVVFSTYLVHSPNPIYSYQTKPNRAQYLKMWFLSAKKFNLNPVIGNDALKDEFKSSIRKYYPNTDFVSIPSGLNGRSTNDYRFYAFYQYLLDHPEVRRAFLTDMRDVRFFDDPFEKMNVIGNEYLYVGMSVPFYLFPKEHPWVSSIVSKCHKSNARSDILKLHPHLNAGVLGGTRSVLLAFLTQLIRYFNQAPHGQNCNMGTVALVAHKHFNDYLFTGYPVQCAFKILAGTPQGLAIKHKDTD